MYKMGGIDPDLVCLKEGDTVNKYLFCPICMLILEEPVQCTKC